MSDYTSRRPDAVSGSRSDAGITSSGQESAFPQYAPHPSAYDRTTAKGGMTIRDYFAAKAMVALLSEWSRVKSDYLEQWVASCAAMSYRIADAMLTAREAKK